YHVKFSHIAPSLVGPLFNSASWTRGTSLSRRRAILPLKVSGDRAQGIIQSVDRALAIIEALAQGQHGLPLMELSARAGLNISTCHHLLATLQRRGYVVQDKDSKEYSLGNKIFE